MIVSALLIAGLAAATEPASYPLAAELELPEATTLRLDLGPSWIGRCPDPSSYLLLDAGGREVPFAARSSDEGATWRRQELQWQPVRADRGWAWLVQGPSTGEATRALRLDRLPRGSVVEVWIRPQDDPGGGERHVLWNLPATGAGTRLDVPLDPAWSQGPWLVRAVWSEGAEWMRAGRDLGFEAVVAQPWTVDTVTLEIEPEGPVISGPTTSDWQLGLPRAGLPLRGLELQVADPLFSRALTLLDPDHSGRLERVGSGKLERVNYGEAWVDRTGIALSHTGSPELLLRLDDGRSAPLQLRSATVELRGQALVVPGIAGGSYTLLGCGPTGPGYDLERLEDRLAELPAHRASAPPPGSHGDWVPASVGEGLLAAGPELDRDGFGWERHVLGAAGLVRVPLDDHALAHTRPGQPDLRFLDASGRQLPYLLHAEPMGRKQAGLVPQRLEQGAESHITVVLPQAGLPARTLVLRSERTRFRRDVVVYDGPADVGIPLARAAWEGAEVGESRLVLRLDAQLGSELRVVIDNGDNPPLPIEDVELVTRAASAWLALPGAGGASMIYGHGTTAAPSYDLQLLRERVLTQPVEPASLGEPARLEPPPREPQSKTMLLVAVAVLSILLLGLIARVMRAPQEE